MSEDLSISYDHDEAEVIVSVVGEIDLASVAPVLAAGRQALATTQDQRLVLDLRGVTFIDSAGVGAVVSVVKAARAAHRDARLLVRAPSVVRTLTMMGLVQVWDVQVDPEVA